MSDDTRPQWEIAKERHQNAERGPGRTPGDHVGDEFQDGHRLRRYPLSGSSGFINGHVIMCDACADQTRGGTSGASAHWASPDSNCEHPEHAFNTAISGVEEPTEYEHHKDNPDVVGWTKDNFGPGKDHTLCTSCAEDRRSSGKNMEPYYPLIKQRLMPEDSCSECGHDLHGGRKEASMKKRAYDSECYGCGMHYNGSPRDCEVCGSGEVHSTDLNSSPSGGSKRFYAEHPSGYRAEWSGGARIHIYEGDAPVDSPHISGYDYSKSREKAIPKGWSQRRFEQQFHRWVRENGDAHMDFNHPTDRPSYGDRHGFTSTRKEAYGETKAPISVDTLREENCPVCGEHDAYDGDQCQVCGFVTPPKMFQDPDLDKARLLDLRANPADGQPNDQDHDLPPVDPSAVDDEGNVDGVEGDEEVPGATGDVEPGAEGAEAGQVPDENGIVDGEVRALGDEEDPNAPVDPEAVDEEGNVVGGPEDPEAAQQHTNQGGEPFTKGPNAPVPGEPMEEVQAEDGQVEEVNGEGGGLPGNPGDGTPDLLCPSCGFSADAAHPTSDPASPTQPANAGDGMLAGDICPECQTATLMSVGEADQMQEQATGQPLR